MFTPTFTTHVSPELIADVRLGLSKPGQKELPSKYLYDSVGSALFEVISILPEYGLTRADERLLRRYSEEIVAKLTRAAAESTGPDVVGGVEQQPRGVEAFFIHIYRPAEMHVAVHFGQIIGVFVRAAKAQAGS